MVRAQFGVVALVLGALLVSQAEAQRRRPARPGVWSRELVRLASEVERDGHRPDAGSSLSRAVALVEHAPDQAAASLRRIAANPRVLPTHRAAATVELAALTRDRGDIDDAEAQLRSLGFVRRFRMIGPFTNEGRRGFTEVHAVEQAPDAPSDLSLETMGVHQPVRWRELRVLPGIPGVEIARRISPATDVCVHLETFVRIDAAQPIALWVGSSGALRVRWNEGVVLEDNRYRAVALDRSAAVVAARTGWNRLRAKLCVADGQPQLLLRLTRANGSSLTFEENPSGAQVAASPPAVAVTLPSPPIAVESALETAVREHPDDPEATFALARYIAWTGAEEETEHRARDLAQRAVELAPDLDRVLLAMELQATREDEARYLAQAEALAPADPRVHLARARFVMRGAAAERALALLEAIPVTSPEGVRALVDRVDLLANLGFHESARALGATLRDLAPESLVYLRDAIDREDADGRTGRADALSDELLGRFAADQPARIRALDRALARGDAAVSTQLIEGAIRQFPDAHVWAANAYESLDNRAETLRLLRANAELDPHDADAQVALGTRLLRYGQPDAALIALREAARLRPEDLETRALLEHIQPSQREDERYATPLETLAQQRARHEGWPGEVLHDLTVQTVLSTGFAREFHQLVFQVNDEEGARDLRSHGIQYEPDRQSVEVRSVRILRGGRELRGYEVGEHSLADPAYSMVFSARQFVITLAELEPGDLVEIRYRIDDFARYTEYEGYFGDVRLLQSRIPVRHLEQVFVLPSSRELVMNRPTIPVQRTSRVEGEMRVDRFVAEDIPALRSEARMPGVLEVAPYLHVSTLRTWDELGRLWWRMSERQFEPDADLERTVRELVAGAPDVATKVARIYAWATDHVHYVGLELGIHGHVPYRVADVVDRGYGDCKDTAALLYAMFRLAGIDARIVLVRTTRNGEIGEVPASLSAFDHAIAYVPELDLYLDGTAERTGIHELPAGDQGALGLVVGPDSTQLVHLPLSPVSASGSDLRLQIALPPTGSGATIDATEIASGTLAPAARHRFESGESQAERVRSHASEAFPGAVLERHEVSDVTRRDEPVRLSWRGRTERFGEQVDAATLRLPLTTFGRITPALAPTPTRVHPVVLGVPVHLHEERTYAIPAGMSVAELPRSGSFETPQAAFRMEVRSERSTVTIVTHFELRHPRVAPAEYAAFRHFTEEVDRLLEQRLLVRRGGGR